MNENNDNIVPQEEEAGLQSAPEIQLENTETPSETMQTEKSDEERGAILKAWKDKLAPVPHLPRLLTTGYWPVNYRCTTG